MKKVLALTLALILIFALAACQATTPSTSESDATSIDMSKFPANLEDWTAQNYNDYFTEAGVFTNSSWVYLQDHATYYNGTEVNECGGYMDDDGTIMICIFTFSDPNCDLCNYTKENHKFNEELGSMPIDHFAANAAILDSFTTDDTVYNAFEAALVNLWTTMGVAQDF